MHRFLIPKLLLALSLLASLGSEPFLRRAAAQPAQDPVETGIQLNWVAQLGGPTYAAAVEGDYLYFGVGPRLVIWDIRDPDAPAFVGQTPILPDVVLDIAVQGSFVYLACEKAGLLIVNVSDPQHPVAAGQYQIDGLPSEFYSVFVSENTAYVTDRLRGLRVVDVSNKAAPTEIGFYDTDGFAEDVVVVGPYAYVADEAYRLAILDLTFPSKPSQIDYDSYYASADVWSISSANQELFLATGDGLDIVSIADPDKPVLLGHYQTASGALDVAVSGDRAYLQAGGLYILDISNPASPQPLGFYSPAAMQTDCPQVGGPSIKPCRSVFAAGQRVYLGEDTFGMQIVSVADPANPRQAGGYQGIGRAADVAISGAKAFVSEPNRGLHVVDLSDPGSPLLAATFALSGTLESVAAQGNYAFVGNGYPGDGGLYILDVSQPQQPTQLAYLDEVGDVNHVTVSGDYAFTTSGYEWTGFNIVDISDPAHPQRTGGVSGEDMLAGGYDIALQGERAIVADWGTVRILSIADPFHPYLLGTYTPDYAHSYIYAVDAGEGSVYFTDWDAFCVLDVTDPTSPTLVTRMGGAVSWGEDLLIKGGYALSANGQYGLRTIDLRDTNAPVGFIDTPGLALNLADQDSLVLAALGDGGLGIFSFGQYSRATIPAGGGTLVSPDAQVRYDFPAGVFSESTVITHTVLLPNQSPTPPQGMRLSGPAFSIQAVSEFERSARAARRPLHLERPIRPAGDRPGGRAEPGAVLVGRERLEPGIGFSARYSPAPDPGPTGSFLLLGRVRRSAPALFAAAVEPLS